MQDVSDSEATVVDEPEGFDTGHVSPAAGEVPVAAPESTWTSYKILPNVLLPIPCDTCGRAQTIVKPGLGALFLACTAWHSPEKCRGRATGYRGMSWAYNPLNPATLQLQADGAVSPVAPLVCVVPVAPLVSVAPVPAPSSVHPPASPQVLATDADVATDLSIYLVTLLEITRYERADEFLHRSPWYCAEFKDPTCQFNS